MNQSVEGFFIQKLTFRSRTSYITSGEERDIADINALRKAMNPQAALIRPREVRVLAYARLGCIIIAREERSGRLVGMATLATYTKLGARVGVIENVVVEEAFRGKGIGRDMVNSLIRRARGYGITHINLTSNPERVEAIALYKSLGFVQRDTYTFRMVL